MTATLASACGAPCQRVERDLRTLTARREHTADPHARIQIPYAVANQLIASVLAPPPSVPVPLGRLGPLAAVIGEIRAVPREVTLGPAGPGRVHVAVRIELADARGELFAVRASGDLAPVLARDGALAIGFRAEQLSRIEPELGARATERVGRVLAERLPAALRDRVPSAIVDAVAAAIVEQVLDYSYRGLRVALLPRLGSLTRLEVRLPDVPLERVDLVPSERSLELAVHTTLSVGAGVPAAIAPAGDALEVQLAGSTIAALANWGIAAGKLPSRYTRKLQPATDGAYTPHFEWRPADAARPLVVHLFKREGGCAHFAAGVQPHVEVRDGNVRGWVENKELEHADAPLAFEVLARLNGAVERSTSTAKQRPGALHLTIGGREVTTTVIRATMRGNELHAALAVAATPRAAHSQRDMRRVAASRGRHEPSARAPGSLVTALVQERDAHPSPRSCSDRGR